MDACQQTELHSSLYCRCSKGQQRGPFEKLLETARGAIIYRHAAQEVKDNKSTTQSNWKRADSLPAGPDDNTEISKETQAKDNVIIIIQNTKDDDITSAEFLPEFDVSKVSCPRCRYLMLHTKNLLESVPLIGKKGISGVCDRCSSKRQARVPCEHCQNAIKKFRADGFDRLREKDYMKKQLDSLITKAKHLFSQVEERDRELRAKSDVDVLKALERGKKYDQRIERPKSGSALYVQDVSGKHLGIKLQERIEIKKELVSTLREKDFMQKELLSLITKAERLFSQVEKDRYLRAYSDVDILKSLERGQYDQRKERPKSGSALDVKYISGKNLAIKLKEKIDMKKVRVSADTPRELSSLREIYGVENLSTQKVFDKESVRPALRRTLVVPAGEQVISDRLKTKPYRSGAKLGYKSETVLGVGTTGILRRSHSEESITSFSRIKGELLKRNFEYFFPRKIKTPIGDETVKTSAELIKDIRDRLKVDAEEKIRKKDETHRIKKEKEREKSIAREELKRKIEWAIEKGIPLSDIPLDDKARKILKEMGADVKSGIELDEKFRKKETAKKHERMNELLSLLEKDMGKEKIKKEKAGKAKEEKDKIWKEEDKKDEFGKYKEKISKDIGKETWEMKGDIENKGKRERTKEKVHKEKEGKTADEDEEIISKGKKGKMIKDIARKDTKDASRKGTKDATWWTKGDTSGRSKGELTKKVRSDVTEKSKDTSKKDKTEKAKRPSVEKEAKEKKEKADTVKADKVPKGKEYSAKQTVNPMFQKTKVQPAGGKTEVPSKDKKLADGAEVIRKDETSENYIDAGTSPIPDTQVDDKYKHQVRPDTIIAQEIKTFERKKEYTKELPISVKGGDQKKDIPVPQKSPQRKKENVPGESTENLNKPVTEEEVKLVNKVITKQEKHIAENVKLRKVNEAKLATNKQKAMEKTQQLQTDKSTDYLNLLEIKEKKHKEQISGHQKTGHQKIETKKPEETKKTGVTKDVNVPLNIINIKKEESGDDLILKMVKTRGDREEKPKVAAPISPLPPVPRRRRSRPPPVSKLSEMELDAESLLRKQMEVNEEPEVVFDTDITHLKNVAPASQPRSVPILFQTYFKGDNVFERHNIQSETEKTEAKTPTGGAFRYALSDRKFIENGWTLLPTEKILRKVNIFRMHPAEPEFDWFERNKNKKLMQYDSGEKLAEFNDNGRGRWYYKNGRLALDYYDSEDMNAQQRYVIYSSGEPDERGRSRPITVLGMFDYSGNGVVFDHAGKIRLKYNQSEGVVLDRAIGPVSHWKWHSLNDPPELQQVMIDTQLTYAEPGITKLGEPDDKTSRADDEQMLAIEFDNHLKSMNIKPKEKYTPHQINMKTLKINEQFTLKVLDQKKIYLFFREGRTNIKCNLGMTLDHNDIIDTGLAEIGEVALDIEKYPAVTASVENLQKSLANARMVNRVRVAREMWKRPPPPASSADNLIAAASKPLRRPLQTVDNPSFARYKSRTPSATNLYYNTRLI